MKEIPAKSKRLMSQGMEIKDNYKEIISGSDLGLFAKGKAIGSIGMNIFQLTKLAKQVKSNVKDMTEYMTALKKLKEEFNDKEVEEIGKKCAAAGLTAPYECYEEFGETPQPDDDSDDDGDLLGMLSGASNMFRDNNQSHSEGETKLKMSQEERAERAKRLRKQGDEEKKAPSDPEPKPEKEQPAEPKPADP